MILNVSELTRSQLISELAANSQIDCSAMHVFLSLVDVPVSFITPSARAPVILVANALLEHDDVLKVGHHGSRTSSTPDLLDAVHPAFGIISAGFDNNYGHPHPLTLAALHEPILRFSARMKKG